jgi:hypothetical protein
LSSSSAKTLTPAAPSGDRGRADGVTDILQAGYEGLLAVRVGDDVRLDYAAELASLGPVILGILEDSPPASPGADRVEPGAVSQVHQKDMFGEYVMAYEVLQLARRGERRSHFRHGPPQPIVSP